MPLRSADHRCPYCEFEVYGQGIAECRTCGGVLRETEPGCWGAVAELEGQGGVRELELRMAQVRQKLVEQAPPRLMLAVMPLALLASLELVLWELGHSASAAANGDAMCLLVMAAGLVAFACYLAGESTFRRHWRHRGRQRAFTKLRRERNLARRGVDRGYADLHPALS